MLHNLIATGNGERRADSLAHELLAASDQFATRHLGPSQQDVAHMLATIGVASLEQLVTETVPADIRLERPLNLPAALSESELLAKLRGYADQNRVFRSYIGQGYYDTHVPGVIQRNILENPGWYTQYTPYQAEIAQGRLEALLNFQTVVMELTGLEIANASLLDEATAAAEAMAVAHAARPRKSTAKRFVVSERCHPQTIAVIQTRAEPLGIEVVIADESTADWDGTFGLLLQYPATNGNIYDYRAITDAVHAAGGMVIAATDLLALTLLTPPGEWGADVAIGSSQRFGVPMGFGGPHAAFMATRDRYKRLLPGRIIGVSVDTQGNPAMRLALQTREQHIRRDRATSNICTAQVLLAIMASMYAVYHGPSGLKKIAQRVHLLTKLLAGELERLGYSINETPVFDTLHIQDGPVRDADLHARAQAAGVNLRPYANGVGISLDETVSLADLDLLHALFGGTEKVDWHALAAKQMSTEFTLPTGLARTSDFMQQSVFNRYHSETEMLRYIKRLESRDLSLAYGMIPLGSCTMKLNATTQMVPVTWPEFGRIHPFAPAEQTRGYTALFAELEDWLAEITGMAAVSLQPNAGSQGEYAGLLTIRAYHQANGDSERNICLVPSSAHGTNPASAVMAGMRVVVVACDENGNIDVEDLRAKSAENADQLAALMVTYPSTHGVFETAIREICDIVHAHGGQVYLDGANMNAQVGLCRPGDYGADVCHLNLHKTFAIPHGGGGPGMGPICVRAHLAPFLMGHVARSVGGDQAVGAVSAAPWGSPSILPISYAYIAMLGADGLTEASRVAILNANYLATRLAPHFPVLYKGEADRVAHECILDVRPAKQSAGITVDDIAKRLMDYGFHAPTMSWPVIGTLMIEPTESESLAELDRFCEAMIGISAEIAAIESGEADAEDNPLKNAPHTAAMVTDSEWAHPYSRQTAAFPSQFVREAKLWPAVARIDNVYGDRNLVCSCEPLEAYA